MATRISIKQPAATPSVDEIVRALVEVVPTELIAPSPPKVCSRPRHFGDAGGQEMRDDPCMNSENLSVNDLLAMFGRTPDENRWVGFADSAEYLSVVTYVVERNQGRL